MEEKQEIDHEATIRDEVRKDRPPVTNPEAEMDAPSVPAFSPEQLAIIKDSLKQQIVEELKDEHAKKMDDARMAREEQRTKYEKYVEEMKASTEPWVDVVGWSETDQGVKVELEWNDAFVDYLKANGIKGVDDDQVIQKYITLLLRDMADQMDPSFKGEEFE